MLVRLHSQAETTPKIRAAIQASDEPAHVVADRYGISAKAVWKWRKCDGVEDGSHTHQRPQTTLMPVQEAMALPKRLLISLDDLLAVVREFLKPNATRSGPDRCLRRHEVENPRDLMARITDVLHSHHYRSGDGLQTTLPSMSGPATSSSFSRPWTANALAGHEGMAQTQSRTVQETTIPSARV